MVRSVELSVRFFVRSCWVVWLKFDVEGWWKSFCLEFSEVHNLRVNKYLKKGSVSPLASILLILNYRKAYHTRYRIRRLPDYSCHDSPYWKCDFLEQLWEMFTLKLVYWWHVQLLSLFISILLFYMQSLMRSVYQN